ncbi:MAG: amidohydrolase [Phycisphaerales bacterium]|jgi:predicted amidohydrolase YtcJ
MREAHAHIPMFGREISQLSLSNARSRDECLAMLRDHARELEAIDPGCTRWLLANAARVNAWTDPRWPTRAELDAICPARPLCAMSFDHHALIANTAAFMKAGIEDHTPAPAGGVIERDSSGRPTGLLLESASWLVRGAIPELSPQERRAAVRAALDHLAALGFTEVHDMLAPEWLGPILAELDRNGELPMRVDIYPLVENLPAVLASRSQWESASVRLAGGKLFSDGTLNSKTAWLIDSYADPMPDHPHGTPLLTIERMADAFDQCQRAGIGCAVHAIGDGAVRACLDAHRLSPCRLRIEHCELIHPEDLPRFASQGVIASVQPCHLLYDIEVLDRELSHLESRVLPIRSLIQSGLKPGSSILFGSDVPIVRPNPEDSIEAAVHRRRVAHGPAGGPSRAINPSEAIDEATARACFGF